MGRFDGATVLITGATGGLGSGAAKAFAAEGARLVLSDLHEAALKDFAATLGAETAILAGSIADETLSEDLVTLAVEKFGRLDIAVNNAGTEGTPGPLTEATVESYADTFETNVLGVVLSLKHELRAMQLQGSGSIVNVSSILGKVGIPGAGLYTASKHAVEGLTKTAALEVAASGIRVNAVAPGPIETGMLNRFVGTEENKAGLIASVPAGRVGEPEEIAQTILFLASDKAKFLTGQSVSVDGGRTA